MQKVHGYDATIVSGHVTYCGGEVTGELPGRLVRGLQAELNVVGGASACTDQGPWFALDAIIQGERYPS
jgi:hypothetical protein